MTIRSIFIICSSDQFNTSCTGVIDWRTRSPDMVGFTFFICDISPRNRGVSGSTRGFSFKRSDNTLDGFRGNIVFMNRVGKCVCSEESDILISEVKVGHRVIHRFVSVGFKHVSEGRVSSIQLSNFCLVHGRPSFSEGWLSMPIHTNFIRIIAHLW